MSGPLLVGCSGVSVVVERLSRNGCVFSVSNLFDDLKLTFGAPGRLHVSDASPKRKGSTRTMAARVGYAV